MFVFDDSSEEEFDGRRKARRRREGKAMFINVRLEGTLGNLDRWDRKSGINSEDGQRQSA